MIDDTEAQMNNYIVGRIDSKVIQAVIFSSHRRYDMKKPLPSDTLQCARIMLLDGQQKNTSTLQCVRPLRFVC